MNQPPPAQNAAASAPRPALPTPGLPSVIALVAFFFVAIAAINLLGTSQTSRERALRYFTPAEVDRGLEISTESKALTWIGIGLQLALLSALVCTPWSRRLTDRLARLTGGRWPLTLLLVLLVYLVLREALALPVGLAHLELSRAWKMSTQSTPAWLVDRAKGFGLGAAQYAVVVLGLYALMHWSPRRWWLAASLAGAALGVLYAFLMPEWIQPLFNTFEPLDDPYLRQRVQVLAKRADVPVDQVLVMDASSRGRHTNAYFVGFGASRRVVLYDTLLQSHSGVEPATAVGWVGLLGTPSGPWLSASNALAARTRGADEIETVLAHEFGHWRHDHISKGIALGAVGGLFGLWLLNLALRWAVGRSPFLLREVADPAGLPLALLLVWLGQWAVLPVANGISRHFERQADADSLELAGKPEAFIEAEKRLARDNLSNVAPTPFNAWFFATHPPTVERIEMAEEWRKR